MTRRVISYGALFLLIIVAPYWLYLGALFVAVLIFPLYWEAIIFAILINTLYSANSGILAALTAPLLLVTLGMLILLLPIKSYLRTNA